jgi:hypothetical protein
MRLGNKHSPGHKRVCAIQASNVSRVGSVSSNRTGCRVFALHHSCAGNNAAALGDVAYPNSDEVAASQFAVECGISDSFHCWKKPGCRNRESAKIDPLRSFVSKLVLVLNGRN